MSAWNLEFQEGLCAASERRLREKMASANLQLLFKVGEELWCHRPQGRRSEPRYSNTSMVGSSVLHRSIKIEGCVDGRRDVLTSRVIGWGVPDAYVLMFTFYVRGLFRYRDTVKV